MRAIRQKNKLKPQLHGHMVSVFSDDYDFPRSWLLPVLRNNIQQTELGFFTQYFLPLAAKLRTRGTHHHYFKLHVFCN